MLKANSFKSLTEEFLNCIAGSDSVYLYGYSNLSRNAYHILKRVYGLKIKGIVVTHLPKSLDQNVDYVFDAASIDLMNSMVIISTNSIFWNEIRENVKDKCKSVFYYTEEVDEIIKNNLNELPLIETRFLNICVGQACNLKCRDCVNFAPYAKRENLRYPIEKIIGDIDLLLPYFSRIDTLHIQGGEAFLYTDLYDLLSYLSSTYDSIIGKIQIATNGQIIPDEKILTLLANGKFEVRISDYKHISNPECLLRELENRKIPYRIYEFAGNRGKWNDSGGLHFAQPDECDSEEKILRCRWCTCYTLENHKVGRCGRSIPAITVQKISPKDKDYLYIDKDISIEMVRNYFMFIKPMEACRYCKGSNGPEIEAAIQM